MVICFFSVSAFAGTVYLYESSVSPGDSGTITFPVLGGVGGVLYGQYNLMISWNKDATYAPISGFCVENAYSTTVAGQEYEIIPVSAMGPVYESAAWIFSKYLGGGLSAQAAQLAIWEVVFDSGAAYSLTGGNFYVGFSNGYVTEAQALLDAPIGTVTGGFAIAHNPVGSTNPTLYQDYVIHVPEPALPLLVGMGLLAVGLAWRRFS